MENDILGIKNVNIGTLKAAFLTAKRENMIRNGILSRDEVLEVMSKINKYPKDKLQEKIIDTFNKLASGKVKEDQFEKAYAYLVLLVKSLPLEKSEADAYWKTRSNYNNEKSSDKSDKNVVIEVAAMHPLQDGKPNEEFEGRLRKAIEIYHEETDKGNKPIIYVPGSKHSIKIGEELVEDSESLSEAGREFLIENGIPDKDVMASNANNLYSPKDGVYNSGDECYVATQIAKDINCDRIISIVSPVQVYRKALFYQEFGYKPEIYSVPKEKTAHNYIGETFWSLYLTYMSNNDWQLDFMSCLTRSERNKSYFQDEPLESKQYIDEILSIGARMPKEVLASRKKWQQKYEIALSNMNKKSQNSNNALVDFVRVNGKEKEEHQRIKELLQSHQDVTLAINKNENIEDIAELIESENLQHLHILRLDSTDKISKEFLNGGYQNFYGMYPSGISMAKAVDYIEKGSIPIISSLPSDKDDYIKNISQLLDHVMEPPEIDQDKTI